MSWGISLERTKASVLQGLLSETSNKALANTMISTPSTPLPDDQLQIADMVRILDVAAEMRSDREMASREFAVDETKQLLRERLLESSRLTGDSATPEEIDAAIEHYYQSLYTFREPTWSFSVALAHLYVRRVRLALATVGVVLAVAVGWLLFNPSSGWLSPSARYESQLQATVHDVQSLATSLQSEAVDPQATLLIQEQVARLNVAVEKRDLATVQAVRQQLLQWQTILEEEYEVRVVSDPKAKSGMDRYFTDRSGKRVSGYYLIVEAHTADGRVVSRPVKNAETGRTETVKIWGESVPDEVWERIKADKKSDGILDETLFSVKKRGYLAPQIQMKGVSDSDATRRQITHW